MSKKKGKYEKYVVEQIAEGYRINYFYKGLYIRNVEYHSAEFVEMLLMRFKQECPKGKIIFQSSKEANVTRPYELENLEKKVREYEPRLGIQSAVSQPDAGVG